MSRPAATSTSRPAATVTSTAPCGAVDGLIQALAQAERQLESAVDLAACAHAEAARELVEENLVERHHLAHEHDRIAIEAGLLARQRDVACGLGAAKVRGERR